MIDSRLYNFYLNHEPKSKRYKVHYLETLLEELNNTKEVICENADIAAEELVAGSIAVSRVADIPVELLKTFFP